MKQRSRLQQTAKLRCSYTFHQVALLAIQRFYDAGVELWVSRQVLREYLATLSRPQQFTTRQPIATLVADVQLFQTQFCVAEDTPQVMERLLRLMEQSSIGGKQVHDAEIARHGGILSEL